MPPQVEKKVFAQALREMGHNPEDYLGKRLSLTGMCELYELDQEHILTAIERKLIDAHYDYSRDTIWVDALDAAHFYFCIRNEAHMYSSHG